jgi:hypothetical protein
VAAAGRLQGEIGIRATAKIKLTHYEIEGFKWTGASGKGPVTSAGNLAIFAPRLVFGEQLGR